MSQSLSSLYVHIIFHTKNTGISIRKDDIQQLSAYMASIVKDNESIPIQINGIEDLMHVFLIMSKNISLSKLTELIKKHSSRWIKTLDPYYSKFAWQGGYGGFSVSPSLHEKTKNYIINQEKHHRKMSFREEYLMFLEEYGIEYDQRYLWND